MCIHNHLAGRIRRILRAPTPPPQGWPRSGNGPKRAYRTFPSARPSPASRGSGPMRRATNSFWGSPGMPKTSLTARAVSLRVSAPPGAMLRTMPRAESAASLRRNSSAITCTPRASATRICSSAPAGSSGSPISCCGSAPIRSFILPTCCGRTSPAKS